MDTTTAIQEYQCSGCVNGPYPECYDKSSDGIQCEKHCAGTSIYPSIGRIFLGLPKGFNRLGQCNETQISIWEKYSESKWMPYDMFNVPVWKHLDEHGSTIVRGICPRINNPWIHIFLEDCRENIVCIEITKDDLEKMD